MSLSRRSIVTGTPLIAASATVRAAAPQGIPKVALEEHVITQPLMPYLEKAFPHATRSA